MEIEITDKGIKALKTGYYTPVSSKKSNTIQKNEEIK